MPPKRGARGGGRGGSKGSPSIAMFQQGSSSTATPSEVAIASHVQSVGVRRPTYGISGREINVIVNQFELKSECTIIFHYDVAVVPETKVIARALMADIYQALKKEHPVVFGSLAFDGRKNLYSPSRLPFDNDLQEYQVALNPGGKVFHVRLQKTHQEINPEVLNRFVGGTATHDNDVTVAINALNVVLSMFPNEYPRYTTNGKSFFVPEGSKVIGQGLTLWRGFFQSVRPTLSKLVVNIDISTAMMFTPGPLITLCVDHLATDRRDPRRIELLQDPMNEHQRRSLNKFVSKLRIRTTHADAETNSRSRTVKMITERDASKSIFEIDGKKHTVKQFFESSYGKKLKHPNLVCVQLTSGAILPLEVCEVVEGQLRARAQPPSDLTKQVVEFATRKPHERLASIKSALQSLGYGQSPYIRAFQLDVKPEPSKVSARVLNPPSLIYGGAKNMSLQVGSGSWVMGNNKFWRVSEIKSGWAVIVFASRQNWPESKVMAVAQSFSQACTDTGIQGMNVQPTLMYGNGAGRVTESLMELGGTHAKGKGKGMTPGLVLAILPMFGASAAIYRAIKHFGDVRTGVATQCMMENKCFKNNSPVTGSYFPNIALKINAKLGGTNVIADTRSTAGLLGDPNNSVLILGADAMHPPPESQSKPSFTAVVGSVDTWASKYVASCRPQTSKQEIIDDMEEMTLEILEDVKSYRTMIEKQPGAAKPKKIFMFRDGVSEGQFPQVIEFEIPQIKAACKRAGVEAKLTFIIVGKRHHVRLFPETSKEADKTGNCLAGTVVERGVSHPIEFDYYLQSHAGLLGTSRPAHYNVLLDENNMTPDALQQLTYMLCHVYARSTRSVSIPAPTYYADIVCSRSANHYDPSGPFQPDVYEQGSSDTKRLAAAKEHFKQVHASTRRRMYFS